MSEHWFSPSRFGPTGGIITQALAIIGFASIAATFHAALMPESAIWLDPGEGLVHRPSSEAGLPKPIDVHEQGALDATPPQVSSSTPTEATFEFGSHITGEEAFALFGAQAADFIDARPHEEYVEGHIEGAFSVPVDRADERVAMLAADGWIAPERRVVVYCIGGICSESKLVVRALLEAGFDPSMVHIDDGGYPAWSDAGHPTETGEDITEGSP